MTWIETHERHRILRAVEDVAVSDTTGALPWREEWTAYFPDRASLVLMLRSRWQRACEAQLDPDAEPTAFSAAHQRLREQNAGVLRILQRYDAELAESAPAPQLAVVG